MDIERLRALAADAWSGVDISDNPFKNDSRVHNWRTHIPYSLREIWSTLSEEARLVAVIVAEQVADREEWE